MNAVVRYKTIYFLVDGREEQIEIRTDDAGEDVREVFRAAAEARPCDVLKLYNLKGNIITMSGRTPDNSPASRYTLEVIACHGPFSRDLSKDVSDAGTDEVAVVSRDVSVQPSSFLQLPSLLCGHPEDVDDDEWNPEIRKIKTTIDLMKQRLDKLEKALLKDGFKLPAIQQLQTKTDHLTQKLEDMEHLSWLGLWKKMDVVNPCHAFYDRNNLLASRSKEDYRQRVYRKFMAMASVPLSLEVREQLKVITFDNWQWDTSEILLLLRQMFIDLGLVFTFNLQIPVLMEWLYEVFTRYNPVPFHNFQHCFVVTQMMYGLIWLVDLRSKLDPLEILTLMMASICHDLDHPGYNNSYQVKAHTKLAIRYNDISPLENHHCAVTFQILEKQEVNFLHSLTPEQFRKLREGVIRCILATDQSQHNENVAAFKALTPHFDFSKAEHRVKLMVILIKTADSSNECRPMQVSEPWLNCLLQEFFTQGDMEKLEGLPVAPCMDRDTVCIPSTQITFLQLIVLPMFDALAVLFPQIKEAVVQPARRALQYYQDMQRATEEEQKHKAQAKSTSSALALKEGGHTV